MRVVDYFRFGAWEEKDALIARLNVRMKAAWYRWKKGRVKR